MITITSFFQTRFIFVFAMIVLIAQPQQLVLCEASLFYYHIIQLNISWFRINCFFLYGQILHACKAMIDTFVSNLLLFARKAYISFELFHIFWLLHLSVIMGRVRQDIMYYLYWMSASRGGSLNNQVVCMKIPGQSYTGKRN